MQTVRLGTTTVTLPQSWKELSLKRYIKLTKWDRKSIPELFEALLDNRLALTADPDSLQQLLPLVNWLSEPYTATFSGLPETITIKAKRVRYPLVISKEPFQCKVYMQKQITTLIDAKMPVQDALFEAMPFTLACYLYTPYSGKVFNLDAVNEFQTMIEELPMTQAVPLALEYHRQNSLLNRRWKAALSSGYTQDEIKAGISKFDKYGVWGTVYGLAGGILNHERIMNLPYNEVFLSLTMEKEKRSFQKKLSKILSKKKPTQ